MVWLDLDAKHGPTNESSPFLITTQILLDRPFGRPSEAVLATREVLRARHRCRWQAGTSAVCRLIDAAKEGNQPAEPRGILAASMV